MCTVSNVGDHYSRQWSPLQDGSGVVGTQQLKEYATKQYFEALKKEVLVMKDLIRRTNTNQNSHITGSVAELIGDIFKRQNKLESELEELIDKLRNL